MQTHLIKLFLLFNLFFIFMNASAVGVIPRPDHVVVLVLENHSYNQIVGSPAAPYINGLINNGQTALFTQSYGLSHPSQPNYLQFFSMQENRFLKRALKILQTWHRRSV